jgi:predicted CoA-binding protein
MDCVNPSNERLTEILTGAETIAVVGLSPNPNKKSQMVGRYLQRQGYRVVPVNPNVDDVLGEKAYPDLASIPEPVDVVDVFRRAEYAPAIVEEAARAGAPVVWFQFGIVNGEAAARGRELGLEVVMDL